VFEFFSTQRNNSNAHAWKNDQHRIDGHPSPRVDYDGSVSTGKAKNPLEYRVMLNSLEILNTVRAASMGVQGGLM
jgi:hypothetical protein